MEERSGMGPEERGPSFTPWHQGRPTGPDPLVPPALQSNRPGLPPGTRTAITPPRNPWPTLLTLLAVLVVGAVVVAATVLGDRDGQHPASVAAPIPASGTPAPPIPIRSDRMEFVSEDGTGVLIVTASRWTDAGLRRPVFGSYLHVEVQLVCTSGELSYGPDNFSAFDAAGELFEVQSAERWGTPLGSGTLQAGQSVRGTIAFDLPRGDVTLLLSDSASNSVTALKIPD